ncbi:hypothetical protein FEM48_Zijuj01G0093200 [Ziziphus jujuba var. spinosa]|uniref:Uncharacterized protein n=1 Tax=Ziziphus jujuba var. spinosa TaxID=714518 RepID=A0A978W0E8_ZIZJJ|nr:hypothetical protein FEM48_Zijuj01G0093200 [Ziziphus jujuba var. spinosa]
MINFKATNHKLNIPDVDLEDFKKHAHLGVSPTSQSLTKSTSTKMNCLCSPTTHAGSFRCRHHRIGGMFRGGSVGSNLSELGRKSNNRIFRSFSFIVRKMSMLGASTVAKSPLLTPVVESRRQHKLAGSDIGSVHLQFRTFDKRMANLGPVGLGAQFPIIERRKSIIHSVRRQSNSIICAAALSATCSASQTQTVTRQAPTITHMPGNIAVIHLANTYCLLLHVLLYSEIKLEVWRESL